jgi:hypothetical protein
MGRVACIVATAVVCLAACAAPARAQPGGTGAVPRARPPGPRFEVGGGGGMLGPVAFGGAGATLRGTVAGGVQSSPYRLFSSETRLGRSALVEARLGYRMTPRLIAEARLTVGRPSLRSTLSADSEGAAPVVATVATTDYVLDGGFVVRLPEIAVGRWVPFVTGGAGRIRSVYERRRLIEDGSEGYAGGGLIAALGSAPSGALGGNFRAGLRVDVRLQVLKGGIAQGAGASPRVVASGSVFVAF